MLKEVFEEVGETMPSFLAGIGSMIAFLGLFHSGMPLYTVLINFITGMCG